MKSSEKNREGKLERIIQQLCRFRLKALPQGTIWDYDCDESSCAQCVWFFHGIKLWQTVCWRPCNSCSFARRRIKKHLSEGNYTLSNMLLEEKSTMSMELFEIAWTRERVNTIQTMLDLDKSSVGIHSTSVRPAFVMRNISKFSEDHIYIHVG
jgi:hypothetical protein